MIESTSESANLSDADLRKKISMALAGLENSTDLDFGYDDGEEFETTPGGDSRFDILMNACLGNTSTTKAAHQLIDTGLNIQDVLKAYNFLELKLAKDAWN